MNFHLNLENAVTEHSSITLHQKCMCNQRVNGFPFEYLTIDNSYYMIKNDLNLNTAKTMFLVNP